MAANTTSHRNGIKQTSVCASLPRGEAAFSSENTLARNDAEGRRFPGPRPKLGPDLAAAVCCRGVHPHGLDQRHRVAGRARLRVHGVDPGAEPDAVSGIGVVTESDVRAAESVL